MAKNARAWGRVMRYARKDVLDFVTQIERDNHQALEVYKSIANARANYIALDIVELLTFKLICETGSKGIHILYSNMINNMIDICAVDRTSVNSISKKMDLHRTTVSMILNRSAHVKDMSFEDVENTENCLTFRRATQDKVLRGIYALMDEDPTKYLTLMKTMIKELAPELSIYTPKYGLVEHLRMVDYTGSPVVDAHAKFVGSAMAQYGDGGISLGINNAMEVPAVGLIFMTITGFQAFLQSMLFQMDYSAGWKTLAVDNSYKLYDLTQVVNLQLNTWFSKDMVGLKNKMGFPKII